MKTKLIFVCFFQVLLSFAQRSIFNANESIAMSTEDTFINEKAWESANDSFVYIEANDDYEAGPINSSKEGLLDILSNDTINDESIDATKVTMAIVDNDGLSGVSVDKKGYVHVPAKTKGGIYNVTYSVCDINNTDNCDTAVAKVIVDDSKFKKIGFNFIKSKSMEISLNSKEIKNSNRIVLARDF